MFQRLSVFLTFVIFVFCLGVFSLKAEEKVPKMKSSSPTAVLYRVDEGLFDIRHGEVLDITENKVLMAFLLNDNPRKNMLEYKQVRIAFNNEKWLFSPGTRYDIKSSSSFRKIFNDYNECFIDLIGVTVPKGAPAIATFRLHCE